MNDYLKNRNYGIHGKNNENETFNAIFSRNYCDNTMRMYNFRLWDYPVDTAESIYLSVK